MDAILSTATIFTANEITLLRGEVGDILEVLAYYSEDPNAVPAYSDYTTVALIDGTESEPPPLAEGNKIDILVKIGPGVATTDPVITPGQFVLEGGGGGGVVKDHQRFVAIRTADEFIPLGPIDVTQVK